MVREVAVKVIDSTDHSGAFFALEAHAMVGNKQNALGPQPVFKAIPSFAKLLKGVVDNTKLEVKRSRDQDLEEGLVGLLFANKWLSNHTTVVLGQLHTSAAPLDATATFKPLLVMSLVSGESPEGSRNTKPLSTAWVPAGFTCIAWKCTRARLKPTYLVVHLEISTELFNDFF